MLRISILFMLVFIAGCASSPKPAITQLPAKEIDFSNQRAVTRTLNTQLNEWHSVRYQLGGLSKSGIDCSGFVSVVYRHGFGIHLPRTTAQQVKLGRSVSPHRLRPGDLVFFKTGQTKRHVGIYIGGRRFIHASTTKGVTSSSLDNPYWSKNYWLAKRLQS